MKEIYGNVYAIKNLITNEYIYIGKSKNVYVRFNYYHMNGQTAIKKDVEQYGKNNFVYEINSSAYNADELSEQEDYYTKLFMNKGCKLRNKIIGNHTKPTQETIEKISKSRKGKLKGIKFSEEHCKKIGEANKNRKVSLETRKKISESRKHLSAEIRLKYSEQAKKRIGDKNPAAKKVKCLETGEIFGCIKEAKEKYHADISANIHGRNKSAGKLADGTCLHWVFLLDSADA